MANTNSGIISLRLATNESGFRKIVQLLSKEQRNSLKTLTKGCGASKYYNTKIPIALNEYAFYGSLIGSINTQLEKSLLGTNEVTDWDLPF